jgi:hypothetical protein
MSTPRCWPASYSLGATENGRSTDPDEGQVHAPAAGQSMSARPKAAAKALAFVAKQENIARE